MKPSFAFIGFIYFIKYASSLNVDMRTSSLLRFLSDSLSDYFPDEPVYCLVLK